MSVPSPMPDQTLKLEWWLVGLERVLRRDDQMFGVFKDVCRETRPADARRRRATDIVAALNLSPENCE